MFTSGRNVRCCAQGGSSFPSAPLVSYAVLLSSSNSSTTLKIEWHQASRPAAMSDQHGGSALHAVWLFLLQSLWRLFGAPLPVASGLFDSPPFSGHVLPI